MYARVQFAELITCVLDATGDDEALHELVGSNIDDLRFLVGALNVKKFLESSHKIWLTVTSEREPHPYTAFAYRQTRKDLLAWSKKGSFTGQLVASAMLTPQEHHFISKEETDRYLATFASFKEFIKILLERFDQMGLDVITEELKLDEKSSKKLRGRVERLDMRMSELRILCLLLGIHIEYSVTSDNGEELF